MKPENSATLDPRRQGEFKFKGWLAANTCAKKREDWLVRTQQAISR